MSVDPLTGTWLPLVDYAFENGVSLSTLRRHIKSGKILHRKENGRYLIFTEGNGVAPGPAEAANLKDRVSHLEGDLQKAREQIAELKTLIAVYEEGTSNGLVD